MTQSGGMDSSLPLFNQVGLASDSNKLPLPSRLKGGRKRSRRSYYQIKASEESIQLPRFKALGYLTQTNIIRKAQQGDIQAKQALWLNHARLAYTVVNRYGRGLLDPADAIQATLLGLSRAIDKFDPLKLNEFSTYAYFWLRQSLQRNKTKCSFFLRVPAHLYGPYIGFRKKVAFAASPSQWFDARTNLLEQDPDLYHCLLRIHLVNAWQPLNHAGDERCTKPQPLQLVISMELKQRVQEAVEKLPATEALIIRQRYGLSGQAEKTLEEVGQQLNVTRERIRQIQVQAEARLKRLLRDYMQAACSLPASVNTNPSCKPASPTPHATLAVS